MKQTVRLAGGINELFGTLDENLKLFESALHVTTHLRDHDLEIEGSQPQVERAAQILGEYNQRIRDGRIPDSQEVKSLLRIATGATGEHAGTSSRAPPSKPARSWVFFPARCRKKWTPTCVRSTTRFTICSRRTSSKASWRRELSRLRPWLSC